jgi:D-3-phosphoglycerate dehydrogenase / 2-oxoglutarate reductase
MKVLVTDGVCDLAIDVFKSAGIHVDVKPTMAEDELAKTIQEYDGFVVRSATKVTKKVLAHAKKLKVIGRAGVGIDNIDVPAATEHKVLVMNTPNGNVNAAAEHTLAMMLGLARHIHHAHAHMEAGGWERKKYTGFELRGKTLGIVGFGKIGRRVAEFAHGIGMNIIAYDPIVKESGNGVAIVPFNTLLEKSDLITIHVPLNEHTKNLFGKEQFGMMKKNARIINVARGGIINEDELCEALECGEIAGAAIDVWENEPTGNLKLAAMESVLSTPHLGASTKEAQENVAIDVAEQMVAFLKEGKKINVVNAG